LAEHQLDALAYDVLGLVRAQRSKRLFIDGLAGFRDAAVHPERLPRFLPALAHELRAMGVTAVISDESDSRGLPPSEAPALSPVFDNIVLLRQIEVAGELQPVVSVCKTRFASHDRGTYRLEISERGLAIGARLWTGDAPATGRGAEE
jgi:circadian clock protein KaiC